MLEQNIIPWTSCKINHQAARQGRHFPRTYVGLAGGCKHCSLCPATLESCENLGEAAAESTISIIGAHQACPHTGNPTKPARRQMTAPQRQHRWLAADHLEQESPATKNSGRRQREERMNMGGRKGGKHQGGWSGWTEWRKEAHKQTKAIKLLNEARAKKATLLATLS